VQFYSRTTGPNHVVRSLDTSNVARVENISVKWDGRDSANHRVLIEGKFLVKVTANTVNSKAFTSSKYLYMAKPVFVSMGPYHTTRTPTEDSAIVMLQNRQRHNLLVWDSIPFLNKTIHGNFNWVFNPFLSMGLVGNAAGYKKALMNGGIRGEALVDSIQSECAVYHISGHHGMYAVNAGGNIRFIGTYGLSGNQALISDCGPGSATPNCPNSYYCLNRKCDNTVRAQRFLDDVTLAILVGCATDTGTVSTTQAFLNHGVDCVIGTRRLAIIEIMNFWNYYFWVEINKGQTINDAAIQAYGNAITKYAEFAGLGSVEAVYIYFPDLRDYDDTFVIHGSRNERLKPAHYGVRN